MVAARARGVILSQEVEGSCGHGGWRDHNNVDIRHATVKHTDEKRNTGDALGMYILAVFKD